MSSNVSSDMYKGIKTGGSLMLLQAPFVSAFNRVSVVSCYANLSMVRSITEIYSGRIDSANFKSLVHFMRGISGHLTKEICRVGFKSSGIVLKPSLDKAFEDDPWGKPKADLIFAGSLSLAEMVINPADTLRTMWQAGVKVNQVAKNNLFAHLYKGAGANGVRQFGIWLAFPISERSCSKMMEKTTPLNPHSLSGIAVKSVPQSFFITGVSWVFERLKNELQYHPDLKEQSSGAYPRAFEHIKSNQGWKGFVRGFMPKVWSNAILIMGANYLLEKARGYRNQDK